MPGEPRIGSFPVALSEWSPCLVSPRAWAQVTLLLMLLLLLYLAEAHGAPGPILVTGMTHDKPTLTHEFFDACVSSFSGLALVLQSQGAVWRRKDLPRQEATARTASSPWDTSPVDSQTPGDDAQPTGGEAPSGSHSS